MRSHLERDEERAKEPISNCLIRDLMVPDVYWTAEWPTEGSRVDVLLIDRAGTGPVHIVEVKRSRGEIARAIPHILAYPAQYRWIAFFGRGDPDSVRKAVDLEQLYPKSGPGRIGLILLSTDESNELSARVLVKAERFPGSLRDEVERFKSSNKPDISFD